MGPKQRHRNAEHEIEIENRRAIVAANLLAGATYREIATVVNMDHTTIIRDRRAILDDWKKHYTEDYDRLVAQQARRYDILLNGLWAAAAGGDLAKLDRVLKIMERQDRILGITERVDVTSGGAPIKPEVTFEIKAVDYRQAIAPLTPSAN